MNVTLGIIQSDKSLQFEVNHFKAYLQTLLCRTYLKLPWRPLIFIDGTTVYDLDSQFRVSKI